MNTAVKHALFQTKLPAAWFAAAILSSGSAWAGPMLTNQLGGTIPAAAKNYISSRPYVCNVDNQEPHETLYVAIPPTEQMALHDAGPYPDVNTGIVRLGGCDPDYDPYVGFIYNLAVPTLSPGNGFAVDSVSYNDGVLIGNIAFTPIAATSTADISAMTPSIAASRRKLDFVGVNLSGAEFGKTISPYSVPDLSTTTAAATPDHSDLVTMKQYVAKGLNTVRLPISWSYLELLNASSTLSNPQWIFNSAYWDNFIRPTLVSLTSAHINTIIDLHTYMHYPVYGLEYSGCGDAGNCPDGTLDVDAEHYKSVWRDIWTKIKTDSAINQNYIMFDLVNEPANTDNEVLTPQQAFDAQIPVITELQNATNNFQGKILVEGAYWTGLHSWSEHVGGNEVPTNADTFTKEKMTGAGVDFGPDGDRVIINVHQYFDSNFSGNHDTCVSSGFNLQSFSDWLKAEGLKAMVTEFNTPYDNPASCQTVLSSFVQYLTDNKASAGTGGFIGATLWGAGRGWNTGASDPADRYILLVTPDSYQYNTFMQGVVTP